MTAPIRVALIQPSARDALDANIAEIGRLMREAKAGGAVFALTPENSSFMSTDRKAVFAAAYPEDAHPMRRALGELAAELGLWLLLGSIGVRLAGEERLANRSLLINPAGRVVRRYDKIHMFDVDLAGGESYRESRSFRPGEEAVTADTPFGRIGMTVCYDLRFPQLYRALAKAGAGILTIPSAFTRPTGEAHWHVLMRARAIENGCFVLAPAQCGTHAGGRKTYGHSLAVAPWGEVLADGGEEVGVSLVEIDPARIDKARGMVPALGHDRPFAAPASGPATQAAAE
ncbi:MAG: carbon-nitrogen hydrolase family protein [Alphaproteobacteria bacterium]|nr:carbon-nitrogen hydrolase family protein [Alphaproteobacteria bacterium]